MGFWESQISLSPVQWFLRASILYLFLLTMVKLMGQRTIGKLSLFDFVVSIVLGSIAAGTLSNSSVPMRGTLITIGTISGFQIILSFLTLRLPKFRKVIGDEPVILISNGKLLENAMKRTRINLDNIMSQLREKGYFFLGQVEFAILEPNGKLSVIPKSQNRPVTPADLGLTTKYEGYSAMLIADGNVLSENLKLNKLSKYWLTKQLKNNNISSPREVLAAMLDTQGNFYYSLKSKEKTLLP